MSANSLRFRAACLIGLLAAVLIAVAMWPVFSQGNSRGRQMSQAIERTAAQIDVALRVPRRALAQAAAQIASSNAPSTAALAAALRRRHDEQGLEELFREVCLLTADGRAIDAIDGVGKCSATTVAVMKPAFNVSEPFTSAPMIGKAATFVVMATPIASTQGHPIALLGGKLDVTPALSMLDDTALPSAASLQLRTFDGKLLTTSGEKEEDDKGPIWQTALPLSSINWVLGARLTASPSETPLRWPLLAGGAAGALLIAVLAWTIAGRWLAPLKHLRLGVDTMLADPRAHVAVPVERDDEIGKLAEAFNKLMRARSHAVQQLTEEKEWVAVTLNSIADAVVTTDDLGMVEYLNHMAEELTGWSNDEARGKPLSSVLYIEDEETKEPVQSLLQKALVESRPTGVVQQYLLTRRDGSTVPIDESAAPIRDANGQLRGLVFVFRDVTQQRKLTNRARWDAEHDALTGLFNRRAFEEVLSGLIRNAGKRRMQSCLMLLDLDHFKQVNDTGGHAAGDALLRQIAKLMQGRVRGVDSCARLGGDEFAILLQNCPQNEALQIAHKIRKAIHDLEFMWNGDTFSVGVSIGATMINHEIITVRQALQQADEACYQSKSAGRNQVALFEKGISTADSAA